MAFESIYNSLFPRRVTLQYGSGGTGRTLLQIDCTRAEDYALSAQAAGHPVEDGSQISDHIINNGRTLMIEGVISDTPINLATATAGNAAGLVGGALSGPARPMATATAVILGNRLVAGSGKPSKTAFDMFQEIYEQKLVLTIVAGLTTHTNMVMESLTIPRSCANAGALVFKAGFKEIRIVSSRSVAVPAEAMSKDSRDLGATEKQLGRRQTQALDEAAQKKAASWAYRLIMRDK